jgi:hypothetical protein
MWPDLPPPTEFFTPALVGAGTLVVQVSAPAIVLAEIVVPSSRCSTARCANRR